MLIRHTYCTIFTSKWNSFIILALWADKAVAVVSISLYLWVFNVGLLRDHGLGIWLVLLYHWIKLHQLYSLFSKPVPPSSKDLRHFIRIIFTGSSIMFWFNLLGLHFILHSFWDRLFLTVTHSAATKRDISVWGCCWLHVLIRVEVKFTYKIIRRYHLIRFLF
jgi:hypothetical protein